MKNKIEVVIYHKNCMDGVASAAIWKMYNSEAIFIPVQHGTTEAKYILDNIKNIIEIDNISNIVFLDFSVDVQQLTNIANNVGHLLIIDHHKTFDEASKDNAFRTLDNVEIIYDINESGATLTWDYVFNNLTNVIYDRIYAEYVKDRDMWKWGMLNSKEFNIGLREYVFNSEDDILDRFIDATNREVDYFINKGKSINQYIDNLVDSATKEDKLLKINLCRVPLLLLNCNTHISEVGNMVCKKYKIPCIIYFVLPDGSVVFSLRSTDDLQDVSIVAKKFGGGGHRNACGFKGDLELLAELYD